MADFTALKQSNAAAIRANGEGAITGPVLQDQLLDMVDAMEVDTWDGIIGPRDKPPTDTTKPHVMVAIEPEYYEYFDISVKPGQVWLICRPADTDEWTAVDLTEGLWREIDSVYSTMQPRLTAGAGIQLAGNNTISVKLLNNGGITTDGSGRMKVSDNIATTDDVTAAIDAEKGVNIAELDANGKVKSEQMPNDVAYFAEESIDPDNPEYHDEYERILAKMYQELDNWDVMSQAARQATQTANQAAENAEAKGNKAKSQGDSAEYFAQRAESMANAAEAAKNNADASATKAEIAVENVAGEIAECRRATSRANTAADDAETVLREVSPLVEDARQATQDANTAAGDAEDKGNYAKTQGDAAKAIVDGSKGDYPSLNDRLNAMDVKLDNGIGYVEGVDWSNM